MQIYYNKVASGEIDANLPPNYNKETGQKYLEGFRPVNSFISRLGVTLGGTAALALLSLGIAYKIATREPLSRETYSVAIRGRENASSHIQRPAQVKSSLQRTTKYEVMGPAIFSEQKHHQVRPQFVCKQVHCKEILTLMMHH